MKTATFLIAAILVLVPFHAQAAPPADFDTQIAALKTQIQLLEIRLAKLEAGEKKVIKEKAQKEKKKIIIKKNKRMDNKDAVAGSALPQAVVELDAKWAEREAELDAKYKSPGKWKLVDDKALKEFKKYEEKRASLLLGE